MKRDSLPILSAISSSQAHFNKQLLLTPAHSNRFGGTLLPHGGMLASMLSECWALWDPCGRIFLHLNPNHFCSMLDDIRHSVFHRCQTTRFASATQGVGKDPTYPSEGNPQPPPLMHQAPCCCLFGMVYLTRFWCWWWTSCRRTTHLRGPVDSLFIHPKGHVSCCTRCPNDSRGGGLTLLLGNSVNLYRLPSLIKV